KAGAFIYKRFEIISLIFTILMIVSFVYSGYSVYNLIVYNNCNGQQGGICILTHTQEKIPCEACGKENCTCIEGNCTETKCREGNCT
ncbi:MAG: hypothetical protein NT139_00105, partial [Candidatus Woesearchaeota archaeon]|nr:hypothetical protein [Candidatus Woesearchaeota archaeon]